MMELVCPAGNFPALKEAVNNGANAVYIGFKDDTNARHFAGLNFNEKNLPKAIEYAHQRGTKVFVAINTYPQPDGWQRWKKAVDNAAQLGVDALIMADIGILSYASEKYPNLSRHLSVQGSAFGMQPLMTQSAYFRPHNQSEDVQGLYLVGAGTHPGAGIPGVLSSAKVIDRIIPHASEFTQRQAA